MGGLFVVPVTGSVNGIAVRSTHTHTPACVYICTVYRHLNGPAVCKKYREREGGGSKRNHLEDEWETVCVPCAAAPYYCYDYYDTWRAYTAIHSLYIVINGQQLVSFSPLIVYQYTVYVIHALSSLYVRLLLVLRVSFMYPFSHPNIWL